MAILAIGFVGAWALEAFELWQHAELVGLTKLVSAGVFAVGTVGTFVANLTWRLAWRVCPPLNRLYPDLNGEWEGTLLSTWKNPAGEALPPIPTKFIIRQDLFKTSVLMRTGESTSYSSRERLERFPETQRFRIWYSYDNTADAAYRDHSAPHEGVAYLELNAASGLNRLTGSYYTARKTSGDIDVTRALEIK